MSQPRILLCGDVHGRFDQLYKRFASVNKANGPFDALLCVGQFLPLDDSNIEEVKSYITGIKEIPVATYFTGNYGEQAFELLAPARAKAQDLGLVSEPVPVCKNLLWLKGSGTIDVKGLRVAYLGGRADAVVYEDVERASEVGAFHQDDVDALRALEDDKQVIDLLLTNDWPAGVLHGSNTDHQVDGNPIIAELAADLKPRYHIVGMEGIFYTREPYSNKGVSHVTRFVALAAVGNGEKQKYLHALSPTPASRLSIEELNVKPPNTTPSPYERTSNDDDISKKRMFADTTSSDGQYWRYDTSSAPSDAKRQKTVEGACFHFLTKGSCARGEKCKYKHGFDNGYPFPRKSCFDFITKGACERGSDCKFHHVTEENINSIEDEENKQPAACWFCLSSPSVETHLVASVGDHCYLALAKGSLMENHMLIVPIEHTPARVNVSKEAEREIQMYKDALRKFFGSEGQSTVFFERFIHMRGSTHAHLQAIPLSSSQAEACREAFDNAARDSGFSFIIMPKGNHTRELRRLLDGVNYFYVELPDETILAHPCGVGEKMAMQFGREVIAGLLGKPEKADWKDCKLTKEEETKLVEDFKKNFRPFDPMQLN